MHTTPATTRREATGRQAAGRPPIARTGRSQRRGFTIIELFATVGIVLLLLTILIVAIDTTRNSARSSADQLTARGLSVAVTQFEQEFGFLPPLVNDGEPVSPPGIEPLVTERRGPANADFLRIRTRDDGFLRARVDDGDPDSIDPRDNSVARFIQADGRVIDKRYSKLSLTFYLMGTLGARHPSNNEPVDGLDGPGFRAPQVDGQFSERGRAIDPLFTARRADRLVPTFVDPLEYGEHGEAVPNSAAQAQTRSLDKTVLVDSFGRPFRYYRWKNDELLEADQLMGEFDNTPPILGTPLRWEQWNDERWSPAEDDPGLRGGRFAIVAAGQNGLFGTETAADIDRIMTDPETEKQGRGRFGAWSDNIVEVGR